jgi:hypothetical protein
MHHFIARENIRHFRDRLETETDPAARSLLHRLLIEEEDRFGRDSELLAEVEAEIARGKDRIKRQRDFVGAMVRDGRDSGTATALLNGLSETLLLHEQYRLRIVTVITERGL